MMKIVLAAQAAVLLVLAVVAADLYAHKRVEMVAGVNVWGYRGQVARLRSVGDLRVLMVGGTRAYGYGAPADGTIAHAVEWDLKADTARPLTVINAAQMGATAADFPAIVSRYLPLNPDIVCIYDDLGRAQTRRRESPVARAAYGYTPVLPLVLEEKGMALRFGTVAAGYAGTPVTASWPRRIAGASLQSIGASLRFLGSEVVASEPHDYAASMLAAADVALASVRHLLLVVDPPVDGRTADNLAELQAAIARRADPRLSLLTLDNVGTPDTLLDGYSYNAVGRSRVATAIRLQLLKLPVKN